MLPLANNVDMLSILTAGKSGHVRVCSHKNVLPPGDPGSHLKRGSMAPPKSTNQNGISISSSVSVQLMAVSSRHIKTQTTEHQ